MTAPPASRRTKRARTHSAGAPRTSEQGAAPKRFAQEKWTSGRRNDRAHALPGTSALRESCTLPGRSWGFGKRSALPKPGGRCACQICSTKVRLCQDHLFRNCCSAAFILVRTCLRHRRRPRRCRHRRPRRTTSSASSCSDARERSTCRTVPRHRPSCA